jgi:AmiR/NasT family two-component response regulator
VHLPGTFETEARGDDEASPYQVDQHSRDRVFLVSRVVREEGAMAQERILIIEDEFITGESIRQMIQEFGYEPIGPVASGKDAVTSALTHRPDVILVDILLKGSINGIQAAEAIRSQSRCPVIYVTAHTDRFTVELSKATEPFGRVLKPINGQELRAAIEMALSRPKTEELVGAWPPRSREL